VTGNNKPLTLRLQSTTTKPKLGGAYAAKKSKTALGYVDAAGCAKDDRVRSLAGVGRRDRKSWEEASQMLGITIRKRMSADVGLNVLADVGLTWSQWRTLNQILIHEIGFSPLPPEKIVRALIKPMVLNYEYGNVTLAGAKGKKPVETSYSRVVDVCAVLEKDVAERGRGGFVDHSKIPATSKPIEPSSDASHSEKEEHKRKLAAWRAAPPSTTASPLAGGAICVFFLRTFSSRET
jgi:hypothetical protein